MRGVGTTIGLAAAAALGCASTPSRSADPGSSATSASSAAFEEAPHTPLPQLVYQGGRLVLAPRIVTVTFDGDPSAPSLEAFDDALGGTSWWSAATQGFCDGSGACVGPATAGAHVSLPAPPATAYTDSKAAASSTFKAFLNAQIASGAIPAPDESTLLVVYVPPTSTITLTDNGTVIGRSCAQFRGYHDSTTPVAGDSPTPYVTIPECAPEPDAGLSSLDSLTLAASHEVVEAVTDPIESPTTLGYYLDLSAPASVGWNAILGGEAADLCVDLLGLHGDRAATDGYVLQRVWSNESAAAGWDPCVPSPPGAVYFNLVPTQPSVLVLGVGQSATFEATAFSTGTMSPWTVSGLDWASNEGDVKAPLLSFTFSGQPTTTVANGSTVAVTVTLDADPAELGSAQGLLVSRAEGANGPAAHVWPIVVITPDETMAARRIAPATR